MGTIEQREKSSGKYRLNSPLIGNAYLGGRDATHRRDKAQGHRIKAEGLSEKEVEGQSRQSRIAIR